MGIGTSLGAYFENGFNHAAGVEQPPKDEVVKPKDTGDDNALPPDPGNYDQPKVLQVSDQTGFRPSDNLDDRRDTPYTLSDQWKYGEVRNTLGGMAKALGLTHDATPPEPEPTPLGRELGLNDAKLDPNFTPQNSLLDHIKQQAGVEVKTIKDIFNAIKNYNGNDNAPVPMMGNIGNSPDEIMQGVEGVRIWNKGSAGPTQMRSGANDNAPDLNNPNMSKVDQLARKLGESDNGKDSWNRIGGGGQEHYERDARRLLRNDPTANDVPGAYNPKEPGMIGSKAQDDAIDAQWKNFGERQRIQAEEEKHLFSGNNDEFTLAKIKQLQKQYHDLLKE